MQRGRPDQIARFVPGILTGEEIWCQGYSEPNAGSDLAALETTARRDGDSYRIFGRKIWTSFAHYADWCLLLARTAVDAPRHHNLSLLIVSLRQDGVTFVPIKQITGESEFNETVWEGAVARAEDRIGDEDDGWAVAMSSLTIERGPESMLRRYVDMRTGLDRLMTCCGSPATCEQVAELESESQILRWHIFRAIELRLAERAWFPTMAVCKLVTTELEQSVPRAGSRRIAQRTRSTGATATCIPLQGPSREAPTRSNETSSANAFLVFRDEAAGRRGRCYGCRFRRSDHRQYG
jgi:hypothetical protein